jgi:hypothetical protein
VKTVEMSADVRCWRIPGSEFKPYIKRGKK